MAEGWHALSKEATGEPAPKVNPLIVYIGPCACTEVSFLQAWLDPFG
jgi:hypothetical protein